MRALREAEQAAERDVATSRARSSWAPRTSPPRSSPRLAGSPHRPQLVVTRPDRPRGRGRKLSAPPVADAARALGLELSQPENVNDESARARSRRARPDAVVICAFGALIREPLLSDHEMLNVHPSLLPRWRGAAPVERALMAGDTQTGVCIMRLTAGLDSGPVASPGATRSRPATRTARWPRACGARRRPADARARRAIPSASRSPTTARPTRTRSAPKDRTLDPAGPRRSTIASFAP